MRVTRLIALSIALAAACAAAGAQVQPFRFVHITDTHVSGPGANVTALATFVAAANAMTPRPAFVVNTGDVTELGRPAEFDAYVAATKSSSVPMYAVTGNHDVRWGPLGKEGFERALGPLYRSFDHGGCHFVLLDSTVLLEHFGHFDGAELAWLEKDLKKAGKDMPVFFFFHHWLGRENPQSDTAVAFLRAIGPYTVGALMIGHGHSDIQWKVNGVQCVMARGLYQGTYDVLDVTPEQVTISRIRKEQAAPVAVATIPLKRDARYRVRFRWEDANVPVLERRRFTAALVADEGRMTEAGATASFSVDGGAVVPMPAEAGDNGSTALTGKLDTAVLSPGAHVLTVRVTAPGGAAYVLEEPFQVERVSGQPRRLWAYKTADTIQSSPVLSDGVLYAASFDGKVYALDAATGKRRWATPTRGRIFATPLVVGGVVYIGSMDHFFYALDAATGKVKWSYDTGSPIFATAALSGGTVCFGGNKRIYGLEATSGKERWTQPAGGFFQARATAAGGVFYLGGWDNTLYALDAQSGTPRWKAQMGRTNGGRGAILFYFSPAIASPTVAGGRVYAVTDDGVLHAVNIKTGQDDWIARAPKGGDTLGYCSPLYANGRIFVGGLGEDGRGNCYALDAATGALVWNCKTGFDNYDSSPIVAGDTVVIGSVQGKLTWIDAATGKVRWQYGMDPGYCFSTPASDGKDAWCASMNGSVYAISMPGR